jgi:hypothetical protein
MKRIFTLVLFLTMLTACSSAPTETPGPADPSPSVSAPADLSPADPGPSNLEVSVISQEVSASSDDLHIEVPIRITKNDGDGFCVLDALLIELDSGISLHFPSGSANYDQGDTAAIRRGTWPYITGGGLWADEKMLPLLGAPGFPGNVDYQHLLVNFLDYNAPFNSTITGDLITLRVLVPANTPAGVYNITLSGGRHATLPSTKAKPTDLVNGYVVVSE